MVAIVGCSPIGSVSDRYLANSSIETLNFTPPTPRASSAPNLNICQGPNTVAGIDVSPWNGRINWPRVKMAGKDFVFIKATEGSGYVSTTFDYDWAQSKAAGVLRGAYHFFRPQDDAVQQAELFLETMGELGLDDLPAVLDWEVSDSVSVATQIQKALTWLQIVEQATGKIPIIYVSPSFWNSLGNPQSFIRYSLWIANYQVSCPWVPAPWSRWTFWQTGDSGSVDGIASNTDTNLFNGTLADLRNFARRGF